MNAICPADDAIAQRRTLRLALGTGLSLIASQLLPDFWNIPSISYLIALLTMVLLLYPIPAPSLKQALAFVLAIALPCNAGAILLIPLFDMARWSGILLLILALFGSFYYAALGGMAILALFITLALALIVTLGSISPELMIAAAEDLTISAFGAILFVWLAHACLPDLPQPQRAKPVQSTVITRIQATAIALRALAVILPVTIFCLFSPNSASYATVMMKVASMGQQASTDQSRAMGRSLMISTLWGGLLAVLGWQLLAIWPSLIMYGLFIVLVMLCIGSRNFKGSGLSPQSDMWMYALITMFSILAPSVLDTQAGSAATEAFYSRVLLFIGITLYGVTAVAVFDAFLPQRWQPPSTSQEPS